MDVTTDAIERRPESRQKLTHVTSLLSFEAKRQWSHHHQTIILFMTGPMELALALLGDIHI